jgi:hypothetical protein
LVDSQGLKECTTVQLVVGILTDVL